MPAPRHRLVGRIAGAFVVATLVLPAVPGTALGWANNGDSYGTHDWFIDQAVRVLDGRAADWFDAAEARLASDDPDTNRALGNIGDHVYRVPGAGGGAVQRVSEHYSAALALYRAGSAARTGGDDATARARFGEASYEIGILSHYLTDILQPYHAALAGVDKDTAHNTYEKLVAPLMRHASDLPAWHSSSRSVFQIANIRTTTIAAAAYARGKFKALHAEITASPSKLTTRARDITGKLARRAAQDLANIIWSISRGVGESPDVAKLKATIKWVGAARNEPRQAVFVKARDALGRPIEGLEVAISWPLPDGGTRTVLRWTDPKGLTQYRAGVGGGPLMIRRYVTVSATATTPAAKKTISPWFMATRRLADGRAGFKTVVSDATVTPGETAVARTTARDRKGRPMAGLLVTWTWKVGAKTIKASGLTDATGRAITSLPITTATATRFSVSAHVQAASRNRYAAASLRRL